MQQKHFACLDLGEGGDGIPSVPAGLYSVNYHDDIVPVFGGFGCVICDLSWLVKSGVGGINDSSQVRGDGE